MYTSLMYKTGQFLPQNKIEAGLLQHPSINCLLFMLRTEFCKKKQHMNLLFEDTAQIDDRIILSNLVRIT